MHDEKEDYEIGFGKPPKTHQFQPGQSGNSTGRPKGRLNTATILRNACLEKIQVKTPNGTRFISKYEAGMTQLANKAALGELPALRDLRVWISAYPVMPDLERNPPNIIVQFVKPDGNGGSRKQRPH